MDPKSHWEKVNRTKQPNEVSWYRPHLDVSLQLIEEAAPNRDAEIIDVGGGESTFPLSDKELHAALTGRPPRGNE